MVNYYKSASVNVKSVYTCILGGCSIYMYILGKWSMHMHMYNICGNVRLYIEKSAIDVTRWDSSTPQLMVVFNFSHPLKSIVTTKQLGGGAMIRYSFYHCRP